VPSAAREGDSHLGFITGPNVSFNFMHSVVNLFKDDWQHRFAADYILVPGPYIHENRNRLAREFLEAGRDWLFMVDNDMVFDPRDVWALFAVAEEKGPGVYAGPYLSETGEVIVGGVWDDEVAHVYHPLQYVPSVPREVGVMGTGFMLVHREVLQAVGEDGFSAIRPDGGEDVSFCWRAREAGHTPWLVPDAQPGHFKPFLLYASGNMRNIYGDDVDLVQVENPRVAPEEVRQ
jgi:hypothetical protein